MLLSAVVYRRRSPASSGSRMATTLARLLAATCLVAATASTCGPSRPQQIHLALGDTHSHMHVLWASQLNGSAWVTYDQDGGSGPLTKHVNASMAYLNRDNQEACSFHYRASLSGLQEGVKYRYQVHSASCSSPVYTFTTLSSQPDVPHTFVVFGDLGVLGGKDTFPALERELQSHNHSAMWHVGDLAYNLYDCGGRVGDEFLQKMESMAANVPYMVAPGNHEIDRGDFIDYRTRFSMPGASWPTLPGQMWYSYDIGLVHFISYSTEVYFTYHESYECQQFQWLLHDLTRANANRHNVPWVVAMGHRPFYCTSDNGDDCTGLPFRGRVRAGLEDLFHAQGVDLIIEAHEHSYERNWPMYDYDVIQTNYVDPRGSVHVISGAAGNKEGIERMSDAAPWTAYRHNTPSEHNFARLQALNHTHLHWQQVRVKDARVFDSFWLVQHAHGPFVPGVNCSAEGSGWGQHKSCTCPLPFYVWIVLEATALVVGLVVLGVVVRVVWKRRREVRDCCGRHSSTSCCCCCGGRPRHGLPRYRCIQDEEEEEGEEAGVRGEDGDVGMLLPGYPPRHRVGVRIV